MDVSTQLLYTDAFEEEKFDEAEKYAQNIAAEDLDWNRSWRQAAFCAQQASTEDPTACFFVVDQELEGLGVVFRQRLMGAVSRLLQTKGGPPLLIAASLIEGGLEKDDPYLLKMLKRAKTDLDGLTEAVQTMAVEHYRARGNDPVSNFRLAKNLEALHQGPEAADAARRAAEADPSHKEAVQLAVKLLAATSQGDLAMQLARTSQQAQPNHVWPWASITVLHADYYVDFDQALEAYQTGIQLDQNDEDMLEAGRRLLRKFEKWQELVDHLMAMSNLVRDAKKLASYQEEIANIVSNQMGEVVQGAEMMRRAKFYEDLDQVTAWHWEQFQMAPADPATFEMCRGFFWTNERWEDLFQLVAQVAESAPIEQRSAVYAELLVLNATKILRPNWTAYIANVEGEVNRCRDPNVRAHLQSMLDLARDLHNAAQREPLDLVVNEGPDPVVLAVVAILVIVLLGAMAAGVWFFVLAPPPA